MSIIVHTIVRPHIGKGSAADLRARQLLGIYARHGAKVKATRIIAGPNAGCVGLIRAYPDFATAVKTFQAVNGDPAFAEFQRERESNPVAEVVSLRNMSRRIFGDGKWSTHPVSILRTYELSRAKVAEALEILGEIATLVGKTDVNVIGLAPVTGDDMSSLTASYQFKSMEHCGEALDSVGVSKDFQDLVAKAAEIGTLRTASIMVPL